MLENVLQSITLQGGDNPTTPKEDYMSKEKELERKIIDLVREIIDLRWDMMLEKLGNGDCPYLAYPPKDRSKEDAECADCDKCVSEWKKVRYAELIQEVKEKYGITESL